VVRGKYIIAFLWGYDEGCWWVIGDHLDYFRGEGVENVVNRDKTNPVVLLESTVVVEEIVALL
jgi:hypothetical protein